MRILEHRRGYFRGTHKGCTIEIERDREHHARAFYITVTAPDGSHLYDGWAPTGITTIDAAKREAMYGAGLGEATGGPAMTERPILFSAPMVRALLDGRKAQTRRIVKGAPAFNADYARTWHENVLRPGGATPDRWTWWSGPPHGQSCDFLISCPYGILGDRLWVKETWHPRAARQDWDLDVTYAADGVTRTIKDGEFGERDWTMPKAAARGNVSPLFMPRWASRLTLTITDVRVERLQDISAADAEAEGVREPSLPPIRMVSAEACGEVNREKAPADFLWRLLWTGINGPDSWAANPWVWAITFTVERPS